jgi:PmbA protein
MSAYEQKTYRDAVTNVVAYAMKAGAAAADAIIEEGTESRIDAHDGHIETVKQARRRGLGLRVIVDHRVGLVYTSDLREGSLRDLAARAVTLAHQSSSDEFATLPSGPLRAPADAAALRLWDDAVPALSTEKKIAMALEMEKVAKAYDKRIQRTDGCAVISQWGSAHLASSEGGAISYDGTSITLFVNPLADEGGGRQQSGFYGSSSRSLAQAETPEQVAREGARRAVERIGARSVPTQKVPVILHPDIAANWIQNLHSALTGDDVFKKTSYLTEKLGQLIASERVTLVDDGTMSGGIATSPFDGEGVPTRRNVLMERGVLKMFVYDTYWARKAGTKSTGSANRNYQSTPFIGPRNLYVSNGTSTPEEIRKSVDKGFFMVDQGAFGYNDTTGAYSYQAAGFWIEKGEIAYPVQEVTVASTSLDMLRNIIRVGNDLKFNGAVNSPTLLISEMTISGKGAAGS